MIQRRAHRDQYPHHPVVPQMRRRDQRGALINAGHQIGPVAQPDGQRHKIGVAGHGGNGDDVAKPVFQRVHVDPRPGQHLQRAVLRS